MGMLYAQTQFTRKKSNVGSCVDLMCDFLLFDFGINLMGYSFNVTIYF